MATQTRFPKGYTSKVIKFEVPIKVSPIVSSRVRRETALNLTQLFRDSVTRRNQSMDINSTIFQKPTPVLAPQETNSNTSNTHNTDD
ncbi:hypothetical protein BGZ98_000021 [Dissophora globulifera]|nr:hypothetical protein BGZ98_000021 [Dissophora globulifera]